MVGLGTGYIRPADHDPGIVDKGSLSVISPQSAKIRERTLVPEKWMVRQVTRKIRRAGDLASVIKTCSAALQKRSNDAHGSSESTEVDHPAVLPEERVLGRNVSNRVRC